MPIYNFNSQNQQLTTFNPSPDMRSDGEKEFSPLAIYDHDKPDLAYAEQMAGELINLSGAWVKVFIKRPKNDAEELDAWDEDADAVYDAGKELKAFIKYDTVAYELTRWGVDNPLKLDIIFHRPTIISKFGSRLIAPGDVIQVPYNAARTILSPGRDEYNFRILNVFDSGNFWYRWLYYTANTQLLTGGEAVKIRHK